MPATIGLPLAFMARMAALLDEEFPSFLAALSRPPLSGLRVNTLKLTPAQLAALVPWQLEPVPWCNTGFLLPQTNTAGTYPFHDAGLYYLQEPSTMAVATLLAPQPGERVLDLCASPGGKATHSAALMGGQGVLVANEIEHGRADVLARNLERWGARHAVILNETPERLAERWPASFDRVLVDAPCSGEGMFRKSEQARLHWSEAHVAGCALRQGDILDAAARLVRPGGRLVYATCTFAPEENEGALWKFLQRRPDFELEEPPPLVGLAPGHPEWRAWPQAELAAVVRSVFAQQDAGVTEHAATTLQRTVRLWPHKVAGEGHFIALLRRAGDEPGQGWRSPAPAELTSQERAALQAFWAEMIDLPLPERLTLRPHDAQIAAVYALTPDAPDVRGLRAVRPGWHLGTLRKGRFVPAHALALGLRAENVRQRLDEPVGSELIASFLHGATLEAPGPDGWLLVCVAGFPLGWGKRSGGVVKNHYPKGLRWL
jgi:16S rRNA C967 or C1407 C5-methylase (RsmB/RsmF family)/NOL1/NOP2/fmu family ribosome biogenesis protein